MVTEMGDSNGESNGDCWMHKLVNSVVQQNKYFQSSHFHVKKNQITKPSNMATFASMYLFKFLICVMIVLIHVPKKLCWLDYNDNVTHWMQKLKSCTFGSIFVQKIKWVTLDNLTCVFLISILNYHIFDQCAKRTSSALL